jgi:hypothetical protein
VQLSFLVRTLPFACEWSRQPLQNTGVGWEKGPYQEETYGHWQEGFAMAQVCDDGGLHSGTGSVAREMKQDGEVTRV